MGTKKQHVEGNILNYLTCGMSTHEGLYAFLQNSTDSKEKMYEDLRNADRFQDYLRYLRTALTMAHYEVDRRYGSSLSAVEEHQFFQKRYYAIDRFFNGFVTYLVLVGKMEPTLLMLLDGSDATSEKLHLVQKIYDPDKFTERSKEVLAIKLFVLAKAHNTTHTEYKEAKRLLGAIKQSTAIQLYQLLPNIRSVKDLLMG